MRGGRETHCPSPRGGEGVRAALGTATAALAGTSQTPRLDAELLMAHALGITREKLLLSHLDSDTPASFAPLVTRRLAHEPIAYITGTRAFWTIELLVGPGALVPRADSETLIEAAVEHFGDDLAPLRILDLGTGPGTLLLAALDQWPEAHGLGVDASGQALGYAQTNAEALGVTDRAIFRAGNWAEGLKGEFDLILANPPYIATDDDLPAEVRDHEPAGALFAGPDGLDDYRVIAPQLRALLAPGGAAILEIGMSQAEAVSALLEAQGFAVALRHDLAGHPRALVAT
ncbi:peptide chain release factor N(5)-glutamine methyltransferase [Sphingomonas sp. So64.6b]|uniref:peptide chain release factor N(5)-glutamine methyltransferase n=1 Tax=Sphingomonas sp. So64.6b TaxID=2997354 RepID=UPI001FCEC7C6|nr:peptide chain release factor N(5)-glutamine methyltransferase [Sphingomonas sp. So64.6b]